MVRAFVPQGANTSISANTNRPPQGFTDFDKTPTVVEESYNTGMGDFGIISFDDGTPTGTGDVLVQET